MYLRRFVIRYPDMADLHVSRRIPPHAPRDIPARPPGGIRRDNAAEAFIHSNHLKAGAMIANRASASPAEKVKQFHFIASCNASAAVMINGFFLASAMGKAFSNFPMAHSINFFAIYRSGIRSPSVRILS